MNRTRAGERIDAERRRAEAKTATVQPTRRPVLRMKDGKERTKRLPGDMKALKMQQALSKVSYGQRNAIKSRISEIESFAQFPLLQIIQDSIPQEALKGLVDVTPTPVQRLAIPAILGSDGKRRQKQLSPEFQQFLLAAETGSGKTLAYLLPVIDAIKRAEMAEAEEEARKSIVKEVKKKLNPFELEAPPLADEAHPSAGRPRAIVLLPTSELVDQVGRVFKTFSHTIKMRVAPISASYSATIIRNRLFGPGGVDVVISTPHLLNSIAESDPNILSRVSHLVVDEADSLLDRSFSPITSAIIDRATPSLKQLILCSATIPRSLDSFLQKRFPDIVRLATPNLHAIPRRVQLGTVDVDREPYRGNRDLACADTIWSIGKGPGIVDEAHEVKRVIVFVNEREKATDLAKYLITKGIDAVALNRDTAEQRRGDILESFTSPNFSATVSKERLDDPVKPEMGIRDTSRVLTNTKVLVMTDIGARGIDTVNVRNVVLYDVPHTTIDFIHRLGRTGRMGRRGKGVVLIGKDDRKDVVREIREGMYRGQALI
jgi:ATP-dependent RNA helicase MRH4